MMRFVLRAPPAFLLFVTSTFLAISLPLRADPGLPYEPLGPSSRKTGLLISEIMYKPAPRTDLRNLEFVEIYNSNPFFEDISGYRIAGDVGYTFPPGTTLAGNGFLVIAAVPADIQAVYGIANVLGPYTNSLKKSGTVRLGNSVGARFLEVNYADTTPWPVGADGTGHSIVLARASYGENDGRAWALSDITGGSPGVPETNRPSPLRNVLINEFLAHTDDPVFDYIELYNHSNVSVDVSGCVLTDDPLTNKFVIATNTVIPARGFVSFDQNQMGFSLDAAGETLYFKNPTLTRVLDAVSFGGQENGVSVGRVPDGATEFYPLKTRTPGAANSAILVRDVVINEIMYHPISENAGDCYVELYNQGSNAVNLTGWKLSSGITYSFAANTMIGSNGYLVIAQDITNLLAHYGNLGSNNTVGNYQGKLSHGGDRVALTKPDQVVKTNTMGVAVTNTIHIVVDEVTYGTGGRWGQWANGGGSSLELIDARSNHRLAYNWADSDESSKAPWTNVETTGALASGAGPIDFVQIGILASGECLVDNIELRPGTSGPNYISNPDLESGLGGWAPIGDHIRSSLENRGGYGGGKCLHLRATDQMWTGANSVVGTITNTALSAGQTATLRFKARWLRGWPEALLRVHGNYLETTARLAVPTNLGTPGMPNSRAVTNAGPAIYEVTHTPSLPAASQAAVVSLRADDPDGLQSVTLNYRIDPVTTYTAVAMLDNGTGGDAIAGDGIYSATIPGQTVGKLAAFYIKTRDALGATNKFPADLNDTSPVRECLVFFGDTILTSKFGSYHYWLTQANINRWAGLPDLSNEPSDGTWVYGSRIIYNMGGHYAGSPYHQQFDTPNGSPCHYNLSMPEDDQFLGTTSFNKIHAPGNGPYDDNTIQREQTGYWIARQLGLPWNYRRYVNLFVNGNRRVNGGGTGMMEDTQVPNGDVVAENFPNDNNGDLYKLQPWFEFAADGTGNNNNSWCMLNVYTTSDGAKMLSRYRWNYQIRKVQDSANRYTNVFNLVDAANLPANSAAFIRNMDAQVDVEQWVRTFAVVHCTGDWDHFGTQNAQNMYGYKPEHSGWNLLIWDHNILLGNSSWAEGQNLFAHTGGDIGMDHIYNTPVYMRAMWRAFKEICYGPFDSGVSGAMLDAKYAAFTANGINVTSPAGIKTWMANARASILSQLASANGNAAFAVNAPSNFDTNVNLITLTGTAPVEVKTIMVNGVAYPATWSDIATWNLRLALAGGANSVHIQGYDLKGNPVNGATANLSINYTGPAETVLGRVLINEIMYNPAVVSADYVELFNTSSVNAFDLSTHRLDGAGFTFPGGSIIAPNGFLVVVKDPVVFEKTYGTSIPVAGVMNGSLNSGGTLKLVQPGASPGPDVVIDEVTFDSAAPWAAAANGFGPSLQLIDASQDNRRVMNWQAITTNTPALPPDWQYVTVTGVAMSSTLYFYLQSAGDVYIDDVKLVAGDVPEGGPNLLTDGNFESGLGPWVIGSDGNNNASVVSSALVHSGTSSLHLIASAGGTTRNSAIYQDILPALVNGSTYTLSFWYFPSPNGGPLTARLSNSNNAHPPVRLDLNISPATTGNVFQQTPGAPNAFARVLPPFPLLWLNEVQADNLSGIMDRFAHHHPWVELYNSGTSAINLNDYYLANNYSNLTQWAFPVVSLNAGQFLVVYVDGNSGESINSELHTSFSIPSINGTVALTHVGGGTTNVIDYLNYKQLNTDRSYGAYPDGTPNKRIKFYYATAGATNRNTYPTSPLYLNEWMAANTQTIADPADGKHDDWFELYNAGSVAVDLSGYTLANNPDTPGQFVIPAGYSVPANGYLLVWADKDTVQNSSNRADLHVNFNLSKAGEYLALYAPNGTNIDAVSFAAQTNDVSQGRYPDGNSGPYVFMMSATPLGANVYGTSSNTAPLLGPIGDKNVNEGSQLTFIVGASDADGGSTLTYSLDAGAPMGATINGASGLFSWTATEAQGPGTYAVTVRVRDDGVPSLSAAETITITVNEVNQAPVLGAITNRVVNEGSLLAFVAVASDEDIPANVLKFSLDGDPPAGAAIDGVTGVFEWTPPRGFAPPTNHITVRVSDNGVPVKSDVRSFDVVVVGAPRILSIQRTDPDLVAIMWQAFPGKTYRVQYRESFSSGDWSDASGDIPATSDTASFQSDICGVTQRFYRVVQLN